MEALAIQTADLGHKVFDDHYEIFINGDWVSLDRVTSVLHATKAAFGLTKWYGDLGTEAAEKKRDETANDGKATHALIEHYLTGRFPGDGLVITETAQKRFIQWKRWAESRKLRCMKAESTVYSPYLKVAGTIDYIGYIDDQEWILDWKTGTVRRDAAVQVAVYALLEREGLRRMAHNVDAVDAMESFYDELKCPSIDWPRLGIMGVYEEGCELYEINPEEQAEYVSDFLRRRKSYLLEKSMRPFRRLYPKEKDKWIRGA
jgi:hypothetical protein